MIDTVCPTCGKVVVRLEYIYAWIVQCIPCKHIAILRLEKPADGALDEVMSTPPAAPTKE